MVLLGSGDNSSTKLELAKVLGYDSVGLIKAEDTDNLLPHKAMLSLTQSLMQLAGNSNKGKLDLEIANMALTNKDRAQLKSEYEKELKTYYNVKLEEFGGKEKEKEAPLHERVNSWVKNATKNQIEELVKESDIGPDVVIMLLNAAYFRAPWLHPFKILDSYEKNFFSHGLEKGASKVKFMFNKARFDFVDLTINPPENVCSAKTRDAHVTKLANKLDCQVLSMPFLANDGQELSMVFLLPAISTGIADLQAKLDASTLNQVYEALIDQEVHVHLPKFTFESKIGARETLKKLGLTKVFTGEANLERMSSQALSVDEVFQKAKVTVDETGAEAAAATGVTVFLMSAPSCFNPVFNADHPFIFIIRHNKSGMPLFMGRINELTQ